MPKVDPEVTAAVSRPGSEDEGDSGNVPRSQGRPKMKGLKPILRVSPLEDGGSSKLPGDKSGEGVEETESGNGSIFLCFQKLSRSQYTSITSRHSLGPDTKVELVAIENTF